MQTKFTPHNIRTEDAKQCRMLTSSVTGFIERSSFSDSCELSARPGMLTTASPTTYQGKLPLSIYGMLDIHYSNYLIGSILHAWLVKLVTRTSSRAFWSNVMPAQQSTASLTARPGYCTLHSMQYQPCSAWLLFKVMQECTHNWESRDDSWLNSGN